MTRVLSALAATLAAATAWAHGFDERYDLPAPLAYFVAGAAATVALSFVVVALFARRAPDALGERAAEARSIVLGPLLPALRLVCRVLALALFALTLIAALRGTGDPLMNLAPTLVWIIWWVGLSLAIACCGNFWPALDPWRTLFDAGDAAARALGRPQGLCLGWHWPPALGAWPAVALLLGWSWLEVVYPVAAVPTRLGYAALTWSAFTLVGMLCFGRATWQRNADVFAIYFATLGRLGLIAAGKRKNSLIVRRPGAGLIEEDPNAPPPPAGSAGFIVAMLAIVLFDGLHGGQAWSRLEQTLKRLAPQIIDVNGYCAGTLGLIAVWLAFFAAYELICAFTAVLTGDRSRARIASAFAPTLVPIAAAYNVAHNFSSLLIQGQNLMPLLSDPLGRRWNLFGTANWHANIGIVDAQATWYVAISAIVGGHVVAIWLAHRVALRECMLPRRAAIASIPLTVLMVAYTAISLLVIAEPMVTFEPVPANAPTTRG